MINKLKEIIVYFFLPTLTSVVNDQGKTIAKRPKDKRVRDFEYVSTTDPKRFDKMQLPRRGTKFSSGYDFFNNTGKSIKLMANSACKPIPTGIKVYMRENEVLEIYPRSSLGFKHGVHLVNTVGIIDSDYYDNEKNEGEIFIKLYNPTGKTVVIKKGDAFAQGIFKTYLTTDTDSENVGGDRVGGIGSTNEEV